MTAFAAIAFFVPMIRSSCRGRSEGGDWQIPRSPLADVAGGGLIHGKPKEPQEQHFLMSPQGRTLTVLTISKMREKTCYKLFRKLRWPDGLLMQGVSFSNLIYFDHVQWWRIGCLRRQKCDALIGV